MAQEGKLDSIKLAVEIAVAAAPSQSNSAIFHPEKVANFIEVVSKKIDDLKYARG